MKVKEILRIDNKYTLAPILIFALTALFTSVSMMLGIKRLEFSLVTALIVTIAAGIRFGKKILVSCVITVLVTLVCMYVSARVYDISYDGLAFHKEAVLGLSEGWNPWRQSFWYYNSFGRIQDTALWLDNYPKGVWALYACIYSIIGKIEYVKGVNIIFVLMLFFAAYDTISSVFCKKGAVCVSLALAFTANPVILSQFFTFMNDLPVAAMVMVCAFYGMKIFAGRADNYDYAGLAAAFASSFTVKFTAPIFCGFVLIAFGIATLIKNKGKNMIKPCVIVILSAVVGFGILGADPYVKHLVHGINPIYPVMGEGKYDIMNTNAPEGIDEMSNPVSMIASIFSESKPLPEDKVEIKVPFTVTSDELWGVSVPDTRLGGFGVLFSGILILCCLCGIFALLKSKGAMAAVPALAVFTLMALFFPETWWARYNPYIYYIPILMLLAFSCADKTKVITIIICAVVLINGSVSGLMNLRRAYRKTKILNWKMAELQNTGKHIIFNINDFPGHEIMLNEQDLDFEIVWSFDDGEVTEEFDGTTVYYIPEQE